MPASTNDSRTISQPILEQVDALLINIPGNYPIIGAFNASIPKRVVHQHGNFRSRSKWLQKILNFLCDRAD